MKRERTVFVFSPQGGQWPGMGRALLADDPAFRRAVEACDEAFRPLRGQSVVDALYVDRMSELWRRADFVQPLIFVVQVALARLWQSHGVEPSAVLGHSVGEIAAAHVAGALTLEQAAIVVHHYSRLQQQTAANTGMAIVQLPVAVVEDLLSVHPGVVIAGENSATDTLVSGDADSIVALVEHVRRAGSFAARIDVDIAAHSPYIDPVVATLRSCLGDLRPTPPTVAFVSSLHGEALTDRPLDGDYFAQQLRQPVRFRAALRALLVGGPAALLELGPHPLLGDAMRAAVAASGGQVLASMQRDEPAYRSLFECIRSLGGFVARPAPPGISRSTDATITAAVAAALGLEPSEVPVDQPLIQLGLDSLMATRLAALLLKELGVRPPVARLCTANVRDLGDLVRELLDASAGDRVTTVDRRVPATVEVPLHVEFPLNEIQQAYFVGRQGLLSWGNVPTHLYLEFDGALDPERLRTSWQRVIQRHDALRLVFSPCGQQQILEHAPPYELPVVDLRPLAPADREAAMQAVAQRMSESAPALYGWPHFEFCLHLVDDGKTRLHANFDMLIADLHAIGVLFHDWNAFYAGHEAALPPLQLRLPEYLAAEREVRTSATATATAEAYWQARLHALPPAPPLPEASSGAARPPAQPTFEHRMRRLSRSSWRELQRRARNEGLTPSSLLCAAYAEVLAYFSAPRFTLTIPCFHRLALHDKADFLVGDFTSTVLLAVDCGAAPSFVERARELTRQLWSDMDHCIFSGLRVISRLQRERREPVSFPVVFTSGLSDLAPLMGWAGTLRRLASQTAQVRLDCTVHEHDGELLVCWDSAAEHFPPGVVDRMFEVFCELLDRIADPSDRPWDAEPLRPAIAAEWRRCFEFNATGRSTPRSYLHEGALALAEERPEHIAVLSDDTVIHYRELGRLSAAVADLIRRESVQSDTLVAIVMQPGWEQAVAAHGVSRSGAAYLPIDPDLPVRRIEQLLIDAKVKLVLTQTSVDDRIAWPGVRRIRVDEVRPADTPTSGGSASTSPDDLAYVIYTSGSTGQPKGVMIEHASAVNTCVDVNERFAVGAGDRVLALSAMSFDLSIYDIFGVLAAGGAIVYPEPRARRDPERWLELMAAHRVTIWNTAPALMSMLVEVARTRGGAQLPHLRLVLLSGDWIPLDLPDKIRELAPNAEIVSLGGATEASIWSIWHLIERVEPAWPSIPYGRPLSNQRLYVLDPHMRPCPVGVTGELYIGGSGLSRGYWNSPELTAAKFLLHPETGERLYRTRDLGRWMPEGWIQFQGRADRQIKLQGHRIELGEIDAALTQHPGVRAAHAVIHGAGSASGDRFIAAYVVSADERTPNEDQLREYLQQRLPCGMVPTRIMTVAEIPLTANGKIDAGRLPTPIRASPSVIELQESGSERRVADIWARLLGIDPEQIGPDDHFFELGGNSLLLVRLHAELCKAHGVEIALFSLLERSTVRAMAHLVADPRAAKPSSNDAAARARQRAQRQAARRQQLSNRQRIR